MEDSIVNKVANSGLISLDLSELLPQAELVQLDIADQLWQGMVLKEKDFRAWIASINWSGFTGKYVALNCSSEAIVPVWAYMLIASSLQPYAAGIVFGTIKEMKEELLLNAIGKLNEEEYRDARVVVKGCADIPNQERMLVALTIKLQPVVKSIMFGEPCSTVPVYKRK
ncbi:MAG: DUF2480 family protein [Flavobacteriales bacterium]